LFERFVTKLIRSY